MTKMHIWLVAIPAGMTSPHSIIVAQDNFITMSSSNAMVTLRTAMQVDTRPGTQRVSNSVWLTPTARNKTRTEKSMDSSGHVDYHKRRRRSDWHILPYFVPPSAPGMLEELIEIYVACPFWEDPRAMMLLCGPLK
ncbi:hypothetical protein EDD17DRAFT_1638871 [Pisolithus thermaeus]|nr:hypothetical protein EDD17DRAFT_1638871 [Pisolithus thermaeus]